MAGNLILSGVLGAVVVAAALAGASAKSPGGDVVKITASTSAQDVFNKQCGVCHMAYPPVFLPARSWKAITGDLAHHFGEDASLDKATTKLIADYLMANAADRAPGVPSGVLRGIGPDDVPLRITDTPFWNSVHGNIPAAVLARPEIKTKSNCLGCHSGN
ncbi:diheme cytochrome c [Hypericibacter sp.]|uniref:diheme cytochrome c n=1 Tax=Hypericibacter sp. TaxID=2705401 RepID=UPI003D6D5E20